MLEYCSYLAIKLVPWNLSLGKKKWNPVLNMSVFELLYELDINKNWLSFKYNSCFTKPSRHSASYLDFIKFCFICNKKLKVGLCFAKYLTWLGAVFSSLFWSEVCRHVSNEHFLVQLFNGENGCWRKQTPYALCFACMSPPGGWVECFSCLE